MAGKVKATPKKKSRTKKLAPDEYIEVDEMMNDIINTTEILSDEIEDLKKLKDVVSGLSKRCDELSLITRGLYETILDIEWQVDGMAEVMGLVDDREREEGDYNISSAWMEDEIGEVLGETEEENSGN